MKRVWLEEDEAIYRCDSSKSDKKEDLDLGRIIDDSYSSNFYLNGHNFRRFKRLKLIGYLDFVGIYLHVLFKTPMIIYCYYESHDIEFFFIIFKH